MTEKNHHQLIIVGSGPAGYTAALYAARANLQPLLITGIEIGGQLTTTTDVDNWPADAEGVMGPELMNRFKRHVERFNVQIVLDHIDRVELGKTHRLTGSKEYTCQALVIATGASAMYLNLPSEQAYRGRGVSACATCDGLFYRGQDVIVVGGGNTAVEEALFLANICKQVILIHRREEFRAEAILQDRLFAAEQSGKIKILRSSVLQEVVGDDVQVKGVKIHNLTEDTISEIAVSGVFIAVGHQPNSKPFADQLAMSVGGYIKVKGGSEGYATACSVLGVFAAGDVTDRVYRQAVTSAGSGCMAALDAVRYLQEEA